MLSLLALWIGMSAQADNIIFDHVIVFGSEQTGSFDLSGVITLAGLAIWALLCWYMRRRSEDNCANFVHDYATEDWQFGDERWR